MIHRIVLFIFGILVCSYSLMFIIIYLNLLKMGYSFIDYIKYIINSKECLILFFGILLIYISIRRKDKNELCLQYKNKFKR